MGLNLTDGFGHYYRPDPQRVRAAFRTGVIVLDTNVLLNVLRYSPSAREELLGVIESIADRCFVPHQIALEYNRNRVRVVEDRLQELELATTEINNIRSKVRAVVNNLRDRRTLPLSEVSKLEDSVAEFFKALEGTSTEASEQYDLDPDQMVDTVDAWTARLTVALGGRVADKPTEETLRKDQAEATRRREGKIAPGFKDQAGGDYLWWAEVLRFPDLKSKPLVVVSDDAAKGDWRFETRGFTVGPHAILLEDVYKAGATDLVLLTTRDLLQLVEDLGSSPVSESTIAESEKVLAVRNVHWTLGGYVDLIHALEIEGYDMRARVIRAAAANGGTLAREDVYDIAGISEADRSLRQFATPVQRLTRQLEGEGVVPEGVPDALKADYDGPGKAVGYSVPNEFVEFEQVVSASAAIVEQEATTDWSVRDQVRAQMRSAIKRRAQAHGSPEDASHVAEVLLGRAEAQTKHAAPAAEIGLDQSAQSPQESRK
ncbi:hypothetical protein BK826_08120 [Rothia kristinae]|uniref:Uncharacterized protein n=1 Tax=Rothia kristinae TaxID=37923 RepID=A0A1S2MYQ0_9MICC|nr:PIN-like domain-containing protein [Rothia kristinae]OIJ35445.1 hypothetical protein BK826_08120 [Rothia kristinae]